jgi:hypothetical protein
MISLSLSAQYFNSGPERASTKWQHIITSNFEIIYPQGFDEQADRVAKLIEKVYNYASYSLNHKPKRMSVILHTETVKSNAFLGWAPSRIEMFTTPNQEVYSQDWLEQLAIHEYRHMVQVSKIEAEMPQILRYILGEQAAALVTAVYLPFWFIEGDAVATETGLSNSGRGRVPDFQREIRTQLIEKEKYSYDKAYLGSFRDNVANFYNLGYFLVGGAREKFQKIVWDSVLTNVARKPFSLNAFDKGLKKSTGMKKTGLYNSVFDDLTQLWRKEDQMVIPTKNIQISPENKSYTDYRFSSKLPDGNYFSEKSSLDDINRFVSISENRKEKPLFTPGYHFEESVSTRNNLIIWSESLPDKRWNHSEKSLLRIYDIGKSKLVEHRLNSKIFAPQISPDLTKILTVEADNFYQFYLTVFDLKTWEKLTKYHSPENDYFITPSWSEKSDEVITVVLRNDKKGIARINLNSGEITMILDFDVEEIKKPREYNGMIYFIGGYKGIDNLYALNPISKEIFEVLVSRFGVSDYSFDGDSLIYNDYTSNGFRLVKTILDTTNFVPVEIYNIKKKFAVAENLTAQEKGPVDFSNIDETHYQSEKYIKPFHLFKFHSWAPLAIDPNNYRVYPGISVMSQNMLSTTEAIVGYRYKWEEGKGEVYAQYKYLGWYPILNFMADYGKSRSSYQITQTEDQNGKVVKSYTLKKPFSWNETNFSIHAYLPFDLSKGKYYSGLYPKATYRYSFYDKDENSPERFPDGSVHSIETGFYFYIALHSSTQSIIPKFGSYFDINYNFSLPGQLNSGELFSVSNLTYLPGIFKNHGIKIYNGFEMKEKMDFSFSDRIRFPRGQTMMSYDKIYSYSVDYVLPLGFPDLNIGGWVYLKRINLSLFYDKALVKYKVDNLSSDKNLQSSGFELTANTHFLRFIAPVEIGFRSSYLFNNSFDFDFLFNMQFSF